jgi:cytosine/adenosine deaminase-related metal-dependent hydrolase
LNFNTIKNNNLKVVYGTDGLSSNSDLDILNEIKSTWSIFKSHGFDISAEDLFRGITFDAAKILGLEKEIGSLEENKKADFVSFELSEEKISIVLKMLSNNSDSIYQFLLTELNSSFINGVWIDGDKVKYKSYV